MSNNRTISFGHPSADNDNSVDARRHKTAGSRQIQDPSHTYAEHHAAVVAEETRNQLPRNPTSDADRHAWIQHIMATEFVSYREAAIRLTDHMKSHQTLRSSSTTTSHGGGRPGGLSRFAALGEKYLHPPHTTIKGRVGTNYERRLLDMAERGDPWAAEEVARIRALDPSYFAEQDGGDEAA